MKAKRDSWVLLVAMYALGGFTGCQVAATSDETLLGDLQQGQFLVGQLYGKELTIFSFRGDPQSRKLDQNAYLYEAAFHPKESWLIGATDGGLVAVDLNGTELWTQQLSGRPSGLEWCGSGERLAFEINNAGRLTGTGYIELPSRTLGRMAFEGRGPSWSPNCDEVLLSDGNQVFRYNLKSQQGKVLVDGSGAAWSPDGKSLLYRTKDGALWLADASGEGSRRLLHRDGVLGMPRWSPDSQYLLFIQKGGRGLDLAVECPEPKQVVVYRLRDSRSTSIHQVCKSAPTEYRWLRKEPPFI